MSTLLNSDYRLGQFFRAYKISDDPFALYEADTEYDFLPYTYADRSYLYEILGDPGHPITAVLLSGKGDGKSATREMVAYNCLKARSGQIAMPVRYTDFSYAIELAGGNISAITTKHHIAGIVRETIKELANFNDRLRRWTDVGAGAEQRNIRWDGLSEQDAGLLVSLACKYADPISRLQLSQSIATAPLSIEWDDMTPAEILTQLANIVTRVGPGQQSSFKSIYVLIDRADETAGGPAAAIDLLRPLVTNGPLLNLKKICFKFFLLEDVGRQLIGMMATTPDRLKICKIIWDEESLSKVIDLRLAYYSQSKINHLEELCSPTIRYNIYKRLIPSCGESPRALLRLCHHLFFAHSKRSTTVSNQLDRMDLIDALQAFQQEKDLLVPSAKDISRDSSPADVFDLSSDSEKDTKKKDSIKGLRLDKSGHVWIDGAQHPSSLPDLEYRLLKELYNVSPAVISEDMLIVMLWPEKEIDMKKSRDNLRKLIGRLREDLMKCGNTDRDRFIRNARSRGYWLDRS